MAYQQKEGQGSLFKNDKQNDRQPDFKGSIMIKGVLYNVSAWKRTSQNGREYISLQADEKSAFSQQAPSASPSYEQPSYAQRPSFRQGPAPASGPASSFPSDIPAPGLEDLPSDITLEDLPF